MHALMLSRMGWDHAVILDNFNNADQQTQYITHCRSDCSEDLFITQLETVSTSGLYCQIWQWFVKLNNFSSQTFHEMCKYTC